MLETGIQEEESKTLKLSKSKSGVLFGEIITGTKITLKEAVENSSMRAKFLDEDNPIPYVCNIKKLMSANGEARKFMSQDTKGLSCIALVVDSGISKVIGDYAVWVNKPSVPVKLFTDIDEAIHWAKTYHFLNGMKATA